MMPRKRFTDGAGFTRHCWECVHAKDWHDGLFNTRGATCEVYDIGVDKTDSPNNVSTYVGKICGSYDDEKEVDE